MVCFLSSIFLLSVFLFSCNSENAPDCFQNAGDLIRVNADLGEFTSITVFENLNLVIKQGDVYRVEIETGEFLLNDISATLVGDRLVLRNENACNYVRDYGITTIYVTAPNISEVRSSTGGLISSEGILGYPSLRLISESFAEPEAATTDGAFDLQVTANSIAVLVNGIAFVKLRGQTDNFSVNVPAGDSRIEAQTLIAQNVTVNHRGSNDIFVHPELRLSGIIRGYGNVISVNRPAEVEVEETFNGRLIFRYD